MRLSLAYSNFKSYEQCPKQYWYRKVKKIFPKSDTKNALQGQAVQKVIENWVNGQKYLLGPGARQWLHDNFLPAYRSLDPRDLNNAEWKDGEEASMLEASHTLLDNFVDLIKQHRMLSREAQCEVKVETELAPGWSIWGKVDFFIPFKDAPPVLLDGKATGKKIPSSDQLLFYVLPDYQAQRVLPRVAFLYYKLNELEFVDYTTADLDALRERVLQAFRSIEDQKFEATPSNEACHWCVYKPQCLEYKHFAVAKKDFPDLGYEGVGEV